PGRTPPPLPVGAPAAGVPPLLSRLVERALSPDPAVRPPDGDEMRSALASILRSMKGAGWTPPLGDLVRTAAGPAELVDRAALAIIAKSFDPRRGASPPTWKVITLTRLEPGGTARVPRLASAPIDLTVGQVIPGTRY